MSRIHHLNLFLPPLKRFKWVLVTSGYFKISWSVWSLPLYGRPSPKFFSHSHLNTTTTVHFDLASCANSIQKDPLVRSAIQKECAFWTVNCLKITFFHWSWPKYSFVHTLTCTPILAIFFWISRYHFYKSLIFINISSNLLVDSVSFHNQTFSPHSEDHTFHSILLYSDQYITILYTYLLMFWHYFCHDINIRSGRQWI